MLHMQDITIDYCNAKSAVLYCMTGQCMHKTFLTLTLTVPHWISFFRQGHTDGM